MATSDEEILVGRDSYTLPTHKLLTGRTFVTGKSGSGKSNTATVMMERLLEYGRPFIVIDTDGEYWGLRDKYEILHVGRGEDCHVDIAPAQVETLVELVLEDGMPVIVDVSGYLEVEEANELIEEVVRTLFVKEQEYRTPLLLFVEELQEYLPQSGKQGDLGQVMTRVAKRGRKHGLGVCGMSQRPSAVDKDYITQCELIVWHRLTWPNDTDVVKDIMGADAGEAVQDLDPGEALVQADWDGEVERVHFYQKSTHDAGATPGQGPEFTPELVPIPDRYIDLFEDPGMTVEEVVEAGESDGTESATTDPTPPDPATDAPTDEPDEDDGAGELVVEEEEPSPTPKETTVVEDEDDPPEPRPDPPAEQSENLVVEAAHFLTFVLTRVGRRLAAFGRRILPPVADGRDDVRE
ncbi:MAG: ATP-binding protein [Halobacteriaceae archaeon]